MKIKKGIREFSNEFGLELIIRRKAEAIETSRWDKREIIKLDNKYYIRTKIMNYELMNNGIAYKTDGSKEKVDIYIS